MRFTINSTKVGEREFFMPDNGGYIRVVTNERPGTLGKQICRGGGFMGNTLTATPENFEDVCRRWHKDNIRYD